MGSSFTHLHVHTEYSMLDGAARLDELVAAAAADGQPALGITDHGNMYGVLDFYRSCRDHGINPVIGSELYMAHEHRSERPSRRGKLDDSGGETEGGGKLYYHLTALAENDTGYKNLIQLASRAFMEGYYYKPRVDWEVLAEHSEGIIATTGCLGGHVLQSLLRGDDRAALEKAARLQDIFGRDNLFVELQDHGIPAQHETNPKLLDIARRIQAPIVVTNDSHYTHQQDHVAHDALLCVQTGSLISDPNRFKFHGDQHYLKSAAEMRHLFAEIPEACDNTLWIAERAKVEIEFGKPQLPDFPIPEGFPGAAEYLEHLTFEGARERWGRQLPDGVVERLAYELEVIKNMGFSSYFLITWDLIRHARQSGIRVGPGRGSAAGCAVAYCLWITDLDPIKYDLLFERFLNPSRISMPDIDMDFDSRYRDEMIRYAAERYGRDHVAQIVTFSQIKARAAVRDAARVLGYPYAVGDRIAKAMPPLIMGRDTPLKYCFEEHPKYVDGFKMAGELRQMVDEDPDVAKVVDVAKGLEGLRRSDGIHAAAVVITKDPLTTYLPIQRKPEAGQQPEDAPVVTQYEMHGVEDLGLLKMDFLGLRNLDVITDTLDLIEKVHDRRVDIDSVPLDDEPTYELLRAGQSIGVFQLEGGPMRALMRSLAPTTFEDVAALVALYRPGPMSANMHNDYADRKNGRKPVQYLHADAEEILGDTYGLCLTGDTTVFDAITGLPHRLDEVRGDWRFLIQGVDEDLRPAVRPVSHWVCNGRKPVVRLRTANGAELRGTADHLVLTDRGWKRMGSLGPGDHVATPRKLLEPMLPDTFGRVPLRLLAYLIADGSLSVRSDVAFVNRDLKLLDEFEALVKHSFPSCRCSRQTNIAGVTKITVGDGKGNGGGASPLLRWLRAAGLKYPAGSSPGGPKSPDKRAPRVVFSLHDDGVAEFLAALWDCDGHVGERIAHYKTVSPGLADDVRLLLQRLGFDPVCYRSETGHGPAFQVSVYDGPRFAALIAPHLASTAKRDAAFLSESRGTSIPRSVYARELLDVSGLPQRTLEARYGISRSGLGSYAVDRHVRVRERSLAPAREAFDLPEVERLLNVNWTAVTDVVPDGEELVYDITVEGIHNFVANGLVVHNCIYQEGIMRIAQKFAGYSLAEADNLRKACLPAGTLVLTSSRGYVPIESVMSLADRRVQTIDTTSATSRREPVEDVWSVGHKPVYRLTTSTGHTIEATGNHPFLVEDRWTELRDIAPGDLVAVAARTHTDGGSKASMAEVELAALLISEGHTPDLAAGVHGGASFCNTDPQLIEAFRAAYAQHFGRPHTRSAVVAGVTRLRLTKDELLSLRPALGRPGLSAEKTIPLRLINAPRAKVERFLSLYFCADGWADRSGCHFGSASRDVCAALKRMLLRFGIQSNLHGRDIPGHGRHWTLSIADKGHARAFVLLARPHLTEIMLAKVERWVGEWYTDGSATNIGIPATFLGAELERRKAVTGRSKRSLGVDTGAHAGCQVLHRNTLLGLLYSERLEDLRTGDLSWDTVVSIELVGTKECFDFTMANPDRPYAVVEDFLVHNCGKKIRELIAKERVKFVEGCEANGYGRKLGDDWFDIIEPFADYAFNKSHSYGYGFVSYQTAYLKANYPVEYLASLLTSVKNNLEKAAVYLNECRQMGIKVLVPDINRSERDFTSIPDPDGGELNAIPFGLSAVRNVGEGLVELILAERRAGGPFASFVDFIERVDYQVLNKRTIESLIKAGAFDSVGHPRKGLLLVFEDLIDKTVAARREHDMGVMTLFGGDAADGPSFDDRPAIPEVDFDKSQRLAFEKEMLGLYVSDHPLMGLETQLRRRAEATIADLETAEEGSSVTVGGVVTALQRKWTKKGDLMAVFTLEDLTHSAETMVFPRTMTDFGHLLEDDRVVIVRGRVDKRDDQPKLMAQTIEVFEPISGGAPPLRLEIRPEQLSESLIDRLKRVLREHAGDAPVFIHLSETQAVRLSDDYCVDTSNGLIPELRVMLGAEAVVL